MSNRTMKDLIPTERIEQVILLVRGQKVILDDDLSRLYGVTTKRLNEQIKRNLKRFPVDFMFKLNLQEVRDLRSQNATLKSGRGQHRKYLPYAFTEHGAIMAANVLNSQRAIEVSVYVVRAFVKLREMIASNKELAKRLDELEKKYDSQFKVVFDAIRELMTPTDHKPRRIGFRQEAS
ncbi:MAG TPA: ORF6N domain-containing protein [Nitrospiraceae bacterium]|nr:ORF6N domain-containing protein [Nitrospiraceae bacterium]